GEPAKSEYRRFKIRTVEGQNDFAMMHEVVSRRFRRAIEENRFPDLILIDGGKGQLSAACEALGCLGLTHLPIMGLAKRFEHIFLPNRPDPIVLRHDNPTLHLIQRLRDEAHRFALTYHRKLRSRELSHSILDEIPNIGPKRKQALLQHFGSVDTIRRASLDELLAVKGMTHSVAASIRKHLSEREGET
ncbi:excinuclease ABC subunit C, partial [Candidatus Poribacteria bacterium]|nr:excinuclease ABC subunit C [Candidatus Poribacteria bacterium]